MDQYGLSLQPLAGADYKFYRDVVEYGADNTGKTDATEAINAAIKDGNQCGLKCGNTFVKEAIIYFPVSQACSLQNLVFNMPKATDDNKVTHVGIFMENGSGGFVSDLVFNGGSIGWRAGKETHSGRGGSTGQGIDSVSIIDSQIMNCPIGILTNTQNDKVNGPLNIVLDNLKLFNVETTVKNDTGDVILKGTDWVKLWAIGCRYKEYNGTYTSGEVDASKKGTDLLDINSRLTYKSRPQYENLRVDDFLIATEHSCKNDGTGDNTADINSFLEKVNKNGKIAYFPAGIYIVGGTVVIPTGSRVQGSSWSQIQGAGFYFNDLHNPRVVVQVGEKGDLPCGTLMCVLKELWIRIWMSKPAQNSSLMMHVFVLLSSFMSHHRPQAILRMSGYDWQIKSEGPSWFYGTGSENTVMYQYQLYGAKNPVPIAPLPFDPVKEFPGDPSFDKCEATSCEAAWALRIINSKSITLHSSGLYSFFQKYYQNCVSTHNCQERSLEVRGTMAQFSKMTPVKGKYTTSVEYGNRGTTTIGGREVPTFYTTVTTITLTIDPITTDGMPYSNINIIEEKTSASLTVLPSVDIAPIPVPMPDVDCTVSTSFTKPDQTITSVPTNTPTTTRPLPVWSTWPAQEVTPIEEEVKKPEPGKTPCNLWFFSFCLNRDDGKRLTLESPTGHIPTGPATPARNRSSSIMDDKATSPTLAPNHGWTRSYLNISQRGAY
ncbi:predicted protein [Histoplasma mississippiense (nom. inval.)]|uniref:predicted protein n=1 Tax=Ajellomyces capsulatus (strain NAm1 / WU24) TaxID=2059318 RepID=UPI000157C7CD|nr:predicted protein [Histoplasma mississippiense (nom. inval.)]EDN08454.1 predicted protein [Histoplasma mississippiense (nom. inval.)]